MSRRKPPLTHSRVARAIAADPSATPQQKRQALAQHAANGRGFSSGDGRARQQANLAHRIGNARADQLESRIRSARSTQQADLANRIAGARLGAPQPQTKRTVRAIGRQKTGQFTDGRLAPKPSARIDTLKNSMVLGRQPRFGEGQPRPRG
jgi:hypothetical protein